MRSLALVTAAAAAAVACGVTIAAHAGDDVCVEKLACVSVPATAPTVTSSPTPGRDCAYINRQWLCW